jgi:hypothetical protein
MAYDHCCAAASPLLGFDRRQLAPLSAPSVQTIQRMAASDGVIGGKMDLLRADCRAECCGDRAER